MPLREELGKLRADIDEVDTALLKLLERRAALSAAIGKAKATDGIGHGPTHPAREAALLRKLLIGAGPELSPDFIIRLWRVIICDATLRQAPVSVHLPRIYQTVPALAELIAAHFCAIPVATHASLISVYAALRDDSCALAVIRPDDIEPRALHKLAPCGVRVIGSLPPARTTALPALCLLGRAPQDPTGHDETLIATAGRLPSDAIAAEVQLWQAAAGHGYRLTAIAGFLGPDDGLLQALDRRGLAPMVLGRYPQALIIKDQTP